MPAGDPAGYLPNVVKARKKKKTPVRNTGTIQRRPAVPGQFREKIAPKGFKPGAAKIPQPGAAGARKYFSRKKRAA